MTEAAIARRPPDQVMRLRRLGALHQSRLSFMRILTRRMAAEGWRVERARFEIDRSGVGQAVYVVRTSGRAYSLVAFAHDLPPEDRSDRVIAQAWDATFTLFDGVPGADDLARLAANVPLQEAGRVSVRELTLARANRSVRLWDHVVGSLAGGRQPEAAQLAGTGYLMRTTAVYGSGKFGAADRAAIADRPELQAPFQAEMLTVWLIRTFVRDLVNHMAGHRAQALGRTAAALDPALATGLGIGNSTGLGMAPFLINHPVLFNNWIMVREEAIARVRAVPQATPGAQTLFRDLLQRSRRAAGAWHSAHPLQQVRLADLRRDLDLLDARLRTTGLGGAQPWDALFRWAEAHLTEEAQECVASLLLEPYGTLVDGLCDCMADSNDRASVIDGAMSVAGVRDLLEACFGWARSIDWRTPEAVARAWYISAEKLEPRLGERHAEPIAAYEQPLQPARDAIKALRTLAVWPDATPIAEVLTAHPEHRHTIRRAQMSRVAPYGEIRDNTIAADLMPIDMLRAKLSFFGATRFDPRSDRWVRIAMFSGAPYPEDLRPETADTWVYPAA